MVADFITASCRVDRDQIRSYSRFLTLILSHAFYGAPRQAALFGLDWRATVRTESQQTDGASQAGAWGWKGYYEAAGQVACACSTAWTVGKTGMEWKGLIR